MKLTNLAYPVLLAGLLTLLGGCGDSGNTGTTGNSGGQDTPPTFDPGDFGSLTSNEVDTLLFVREEEKLARDVYLQLYTQWGKNIFQNIATKSEQKHMDAIKVLLDGYGLNDPVSSDAVGAFTNTDIRNLYQQLLDRGMASMNEALQVGAYIEEYDIEDLQAAIQEAVDGSNPAPIIETYTRLQCGSRNHLRSFVQQLEMSGITYQSQLLSQSAVDTIVDTDKETCN